METAEKTEVALIAQELAEFYRSEQHSTARCIRLYMHFMNMETHLFRIGFLIRQTVCNAREAIHHKNDFHKSGLQHIDLKVTETNHHHDSALHP
jgi:hypothetical protein